MELPCTTGRTRDLTGTLQGLAIAETNAAERCATVLEGPVVRQTGFRPRLRKFYRWRLGRSNAYFLGEETTRAGNVSSSARGASALRSRFCVLSFSEELPSSWRLL
jgi:hypothetical protein